MPETSRSVVKSRTEPQSGTRPRPRPIAGVIFDLDGTLIHSAPDITAALNVVLVECGLEAFAIKQACGFVGAGARRLIADAFTARGHTLTEDEVSRLTARYLDVYARSGSPHTTLYSGVRETLETLGKMGVALAVCTNKAEAISRDVLAQLRLDTVFAAIIGGDSGFGRKPDPGPLNEACRRMSTAAADVLMVGDTIMDVGAARAAGSRVAVVRHGYSQTPVETIGADLLLDDLSHIIALVTPG
ncbi:MAG: phosphoglycolate phosphatase [Rhodospirillaceae bacterium]|nr:MAG: phosphoglycolate phosphatase [Rhodospirillaceae bacterium]